MRDQLLRSALALAGGWGQRLGLLPVLGRFGRWGVGLVCVGLLFFVCVWGRVFCVVLFGVILGLFWQGGLTWG
jgi:hypothetical protein